MTINLKPCPISNSTNTHIFHELDDVPTNSFRLTKSHEEAVALAQGFMRLAICADSGFVYNAAFDESLPIYDEHYEASQGFSKTFQAWTTDVVSRFVERYQLYSKTFCELGCGQGEFLAETIKQTGGAGTGYDPAWVPGFVDEQALASIDYRKELFTQDTIGIKFDAFIHRHTLEHVADPVGHMTMVRKAMEENPGSVLFLEVPDAERIWGEVAFWDVFYEHCNYFTADTFRSMLIQCGFDVLDLRYEYSDQYLVAELKVADKDVEQTPVNIEKAMKDAQFFEQSTAAKRQEIEDIVGKSQRPVIWGAGSKGVGFLTTMGYDEDRFSFAVDIDPHKQGTFMAGSGQPVVAPEDLVAHNPDLVIVMNPVYQAEIQKQLESLGIDCKVESL